MVTGTAVVVLAGSGVRVVPPRQPAASPTPSVFPLLACTPLDSWCTRAGTIRWSVPLAEELFEDEGFLFPRKAAGTTVPPQCIRKAGRAYYRYTHGVLRAYDADTGAVRWSADVPAPAEEYCHLYADAGQVILVPEGSPPTTKTVTVLSADNGRLVGRWLTPYPYTNTRTSWSHLVAISGGRSMWATTSGEVCAVDQTTGQRVWTTPVTPFAGLHIQGGVLYLDKGGDNTGLTRDLDQVQRVDLATGTRSLLRLPTPIGPGGHLYFGTSQADAYTGLDGILPVETNDAAAAISTSDGSLRWRRAGEKTRRPDDTQAVTHIQAVDALANRVYLNYSPSKVRSVDVATGAVSGPQNHWSIYGWAVIDNITLDEDHDILYARDTRTMAQRWRVPVPRYFAASDGDDIQAPRVLIGEGCATASTPTDRSGSPSATTPPRTFNHCPKPILVAVNF